MIILRKFLFVKYNLLRHKYKHNLNFILYYGYEKLFMLQPGVMQKKKSGHPLFLYRITYPLEYSQSEEVIQLAKQYEKHNSRNNEFKANIPEIIGLNLIAGGLFNLILNNNCLEFPTDYQ